VSTTDGGESRFGARKSSPQFGALEDELTDDGD
jgi:hypothetical protein